MDVEKSTPDARLRAGRDSTRAVTTDCNLADQIATVLLCDREPIRKAFVGEPVMEAMLMCAWALDHEHEPDFDAARALQGWAKKRQRGAWREHRMPEIEQFLDTIQCEATRYADCFDCGARRKLRDMFEVGPVEADHSLEFGGGELLCTDCSSRHGVR